MGAPDRYEEVVPPSRTWCNGVSSTGISATSITWCALELIDRRDILAGGAGCLRFGIKWPIGTFFRIFIAEEVGVPGASVGDVLVPSVLLRDRKVDFGDKNSTKDGRPFGEELRVRSGGGSGERCGDDTNLSPERGLFGEDPTSELSFVGLFDSVDVSEYLPDEESIPRCVRFISSLSWSTITVERFWPIFGRNIDDTPVSTTLASSRSSASSLPRISSSSKNVLSDTPPSSSSIV